MNNVVALKKPNLTKTKFYERTAEEDVIYKHHLKIRQISDVIKNKFGRKIHFTQCHRILNREYNQKLLESA